MIAFVGADRPADQQRVIEAQRRAVERGGDNAMFTREVGQPATLAVQAFGRGDHIAAVEGLRPIRSHANRFGGSHAQRDMFSWTMTEAAIRIGDRALADAFVAERLLAKPESPVNKAWAMRAEKLKRSQAA